MGNIKFDYSNSFVKEDEIQQIEPLISKCHELLHEARGFGQELTGWIDLPNTYDKSEFKRIQKTAENIRETSDIFLVIGIGGSYLGARACIEALSHSFYNDISKDKRRGPRIYYLGNNLSGKYLLDFLDLLDGKDISINVISKSGETLESALAFRILKKYMEDRYGKIESVERTYITTDSSKGLLRDLSKRKDYNTFSIPDNIGGRFSIFTPVGLLPIAVGGIDIEKLMEGARSGVEEYGVADVDGNISCQYAGVRNILYRKGKLIEIIANYEPSLHYLCEWWKQLYGESEGKDGMGIFPMSVNFTSDLHSLGQIIQDGRKNLFETTLNIEKPYRDRLIEGDLVNLDKLNYLEGESFDSINKKAFQATVKAHVEGGVPNLIVNIPRMDEYYFGKLIYFYQVACGISAYLLGVNPFDQPGVEGYKKNMFKLLERPRD